MPAGWVRVLYIVLAFLALWGVVSWLDRRRLSGLGFRADRLWWRDLACGIGVAFSLVSAIFIAFWFLGWISIRSWRATTGSTPFWGALAVQLGLYACSATYEEILCRGYLQSNLREGLRLPILGARGAIAAGWILSAVLFGLMHAGNPHATLLSSTNIILFGALLGLIVIIRGSLAIPIGLHLGWNFSLGNIFGFTVSGLAPETSILALRQRGAGVVLWTGGAFGPEGGLLMFLILVSLLVAAATVSVRALRGPQPAA